MAKAYGYPTAIEHFQQNKSQREKKQQQQKIEEGNQGGAERCLVGVAPVLPTDKATELSAEGVAHPVIDPASASWADLAQSSPSLSLSFSICTMRGVYLMISNFLETLTYSLCACAWACTAHQSTWGAR